jgi:translation elongation factor EF-G
MSTSNSEPVNFPPKRIHIYGHVSASPSALAQAFQGVVAEDAVADSDLAIFAINPSAGIDSHTISLWHELDQFQIPRLVVVNGIEGQEQDFDDAVLVARRVLDDVITPYLVLHDEKGEPTALIRLQDLEIIDYSTSPPSQKHCDPEHEELVRDFREEYFEQTSEMDEGAFAAGIIFPAIPINLNKGIGVDVVLDYIKQLPSGS